MTRRLLLVALVVCVVGPVLAQGQGAPSRKMYTPEQIRQMSVADLFSHLTLTEDGYSGGAAIMALIAKAKASDDDRKQIETASLQLARNADLNWGERTQHFYLLAGLQSAAAVPLLAFALVRGGPRTFGPSFDKTKLDNLTLGLEQLAGRNLVRMPLVIGRLARTRRTIARLSASYDVLLTPTLADVTPRIGHLDPTAPYEQIIDRLIDWVAFTPLQNVTGDPAISLPLGQSADGLPVGMMFAAPVGQERLLLELAYELEEAQAFPRIQE